ncbi:MAG: hypothetical protein R3B68_07380 [Phycisphaerales bacterium]
MRRPSTKIRRNRALHAFALEALEERRVFAAVFWDGGGGDLFWNNPLNWSNNSIPTSIDSVSISAQPGLGPISIAGAPARASYLTTSHDLTVNANASLRVENGLFARPGSDLMVAGELVWRGGTMDDGGVTTIAPGGVLTISAPSSVQSDRHLTNQGIIRWNAGSMYFSGSHSVLENAAGGVIVAATGGTRMSEVFSPVGIVNNGRIQAEGTGTITIDVPLENRGIVEVRHGTLALQGSGTNSGAFETDFGASLRIGGFADPFAFLNGTTFSGGGAVFLTDAGHTIQGTIDLGPSGVVVDSYETALITTGPTTILGDLTLSKNPTLDFRHSVRMFGMLNMDRGALTGDGHVWIHGGMRWGQATLGGSGVVRIQRGAQLDMGDNVLRTISDSRQVWNNGTTDWTAGSIWIKHGTSVFQNLRGGRFNADADGSLIYGDGQFINKGFFEVDIASNAQITVGAEFSNATQAGFGGLKVVSGSLRLTGDVPQFAATGSLKYGVWSINSNASIITEPTARLTWNSAFVTLQGTATFSGLNALRQNNGTLTLDRASSFLENLSGELVNSGTLVKSGSGIARIDAPFRNLGSIVVEGPGGAGSSIGELIIDAGAGEFVNSGSISIASRARVQVIGDFRQTSSATLSIGASGTAVHEVGRLWVRGASTLSGSLRFAPEAGLTPVGGQIYTFFKSDAGRSGLFGPVAAPSLGGGMVAVLTTVPSGLGVRINA